MSKRQKPTLMILAGAVILAAVGTYTMLQNEQQQPEKIQSMNQTPEEEKSVTEKTESTSQGEEVKAQNETGPKVGETVETSSGLKYRICKRVKELSRRTKSGESPLPWKTGRRHRI